MEPTMDGAFTSRNGFFNDMTRKTLREKEHGGRIGMGMEPTMDGAFTSRNGFFNDMTRKTLREKGLGGMGRKHQPYSDIPAEMMQGAGLLDSGAKVYAWLKAHKSVIHGILDSPYMNEQNPAGETDFPKKVSGALSKVGLGYKEGGRIGMGKRAPSAYAMFVKSYAAKHPGLGKSLMSEAAKAWKASK
jgi:hypothetical protein